MVGKEGNIQEKFAQAQGPVVQSATSANPGLKFNFCLCISACLFISRKLNFC
jgi:hypothetical protein